MSFDSSDSFDDEDIDFDQLYSARSQSHGLRNVSPALKEPSTDPLALRGENAILRAQLQKISSKYEQEQKNLKQHYASLLEERNKRITELAEDVNKVKEDNEFLTSENKNLTTKYLPAPKKRRIQDESMDVSVSDISGRSFSTKATSTPPESKPQTLAIINQVSVFQDEKNSFIEGISAHVIPGFGRTTLDYLANISSAISYEKGDFRVTKGKENIKTAIIDYLIRFENKNRIDILLSDFINILFDYITCCFESANLFAGPFLLALIHFALNYRAKAISFELIQRSMEVTNYLLTFSTTVLKQDQPYLSNENLDITTTANSASTDLKLDTVQKTMHSKVLDVFTTVYLMDIMETLAKLSSYLDVGNEPYLTEYWSSFQKSLISHCLSMKTPIGFVFNMVEILNYSVNKNSFAFAHASRSKRQGYSKESTDILTNLILFLTQGLEQDLYTYGLNRTIGSNGYSRLLEMLVTHDASPSPMSHSWDRYQQILQVSSNIGQINKHEIVVLSLRIRILQLFENLLAQKPASAIKNETLIAFISSIVTQLGYQQEIIYRSPRAKTIGHRLQLISLIVRLIHFLVSASAKVAISDLPGITLREMVIALLRISAESLKPLALETIRQWRDLGHVPEISPAPNGVEINYDDWTIDMARDVISQCITGDEADALHYSINYDIPDDDMLE
ncbi:hypothetical protein OGAPHI_007267 [Ogataea philodendri]|uniref:DNA damage checkpoint protein LCD1 n=1 Tax=Ogataea philodendri TaxID=1378263 RepID=A0A9P8NUU8_9ASCO|nr:uncharacterized protein OGAPHI_007267 [Ogataea philodendri]KAH3660062.1 hypothetical protein OGAPHI_007267 [Ogataea philodendri]